MRNPARLLWIAALGLVASCRPDAGETARRTAARVLTGVVGYPGAVLTAVQGEGDAAQLTFETGAPADTVAAWYRAFLRLNRWSLRADRREVDGRITLYAERDSASAPAPVWIMIEPMRGPAGGSLFTLVGAEPGPADTIGPAPTPVRPRAPVRRQIH